jgi:hypothetical protein
MENEMNQTKTSPADEGFEALNNENAMSQSPATILLKFAVIPSNADPATGKFLVRLEVPLDKLPANSDQHRDFITEASDLIRQMFAPSDSCVYMINEAEDETEQSKISVRISFSQLRTDLVDANMRLSKIETAAKAVIGAWENGDLASAINNLRLMMNE